MKLSTDLISTINEQIMLEQYSAQLYLAMSVEFDDRNLKGMANFFWKHYLEELNHAYDMIHYLQRRGAKPAISAISQVPTEFGSALEIFEQALAHEKEVTARIHSIVKQAIEKEDYGVETFFRKYVEEQEEEEELFTDIVEQMKLDHGTHGLIHTNKRLARYGEK